MTVSMYNETRELDPIMISARGRPAIAPAIQDLDSHNTSTLLEATRVMRPIGRSALEFGADPFAE